MITKNRVFMYSIQHTGTHFIRELVKTITTEEKAIRTARYDNLIAKQRENYSIEKMLNFTTSKVPKNLLNKAELLIYFSHHFNRESLLFKSIIETKPSIPIISPIRDPLLYINTRLFVRNIYKDKTKRAQEVIEATKLFIDMLSIPDEHRFLFPIDLYNKNINATENRIKQSKRLFEFCNIKPSKETIKFCASWDPKFVTQNNAKSKDSKNNKNIKKELHFNNKQAIKNKNKKFIKREMGVELSYLQKQDDLKKLLEKYGYTDLVWW